MVPAAEHVADLLVFLTQWERRGPLLIHCRAGIDRSPATAFIAACLHNPDADEHEIAAALRLAGPLSRPNETLVGIADTAMGRDGRMRDAISDTGRGLPWLEIDEGEPFGMPSAF